MQRGSEEKRDMKPKEMRLFHMITLAVFLVMMDLFVAGSDGLRNVRLESPAYVRRNSSSVVMYCNYDLERVGLYAVKWYRGKHEFYRFIPKEMPPKKTFPEAGILVNEALSDDHKLVLLNVTAASEGKFSCSVSTEETFQTLADEKELKAIEIGESPPMLAVNSRVFRPGDRIQANCTLPDASVRVNMTWYLDGKEIIPQKSLRESHREPTTITVREYPTSYANELATTKSTLSLTLPPAFSASELRCRATVYDLYDQFALLRLDGPPNDEPAGRILVSSSSSAAGGAGRNGFHLEALALLASMWRLIATTTGGWKRYERLSIQG